MDPKNDVKQTIRDNLAAQFGGQKGKTIVESVEALIVESIKAVADTLIDAKLGALGKLAEPAVNEVIDLAAGAVRDATDRELDKLAGAPAAQPNPAVPAADGGGFLAKLKAFVDGEMAKAGK